MTLPVSIGSCSVCCSPSSRSCAAQFWHNPPAKRHCIRLRKPVSPLFWRQELVTCQDGLSATVSESAAVQEQPTDQPARSGLARQILSQPGIEGEPLKFLKSMEAYWTAQRTARPRPPPPVVRTRGYRLTAAPEFDVVVVGGTLGVFLALALQLRGHNVCIVERRRVEGRSQEWNVSRNELQILLELGLVNDQELQEAIATEFNPSRVSFNDRFEMWVEDVLNLGVVPRTLIATMRHRFLDAGGVIREHTSFQSAEVCSDGVAIRLSVGAGSEPISVSDANRPLATYPQRETIASSPESDEELLRPPGAPQPSHPPSSSNGAGRPAPRRAGRDRQGPDRPGRPREGSAQGEEVRARLLVDCMGHWSPIVKQIRGTQRPDGMCLVVGGCASGFTPETNKRGDFLRTVTDGEDDMQLLWQAFPAAGGRDRTTYMFAYVDDNRHRPSLETMLDRYFELLPRVCGMPLAYLSFRRMLFAGLPSYANSPLKPRFDRVLQVGDASSCSSPISFGGFGSMLRHLGRLTCALDQALAQDRLSQSTLAMLQPYQPSLSVSWLFQRAMSYQVGQLRAPPRQQRKSAARRGWLPPHHVNQLLSSNFRVLQVLGEGVVRRFVQDTYQWGPLSLTMAGMLLTSPLVILRVVGQVGPRMLLSWFCHYFALTAYALLARVGPVLKLLPKLGASYWLARQLEAWRYGAGLDWHAGPVRQDNGAQPAAQPGHA